jgi:glycosyltransferase involved in cell wall biosynthesis
MACGLAVLATDVGATSILVNQKTGWLLPSPDVRELKDKLFEIMALSPLQLMEKKRNARKLIEAQFTWERLIDIFLSHFKPLEH